MHTVTTLRVPQSTKKQVLCGANAQTGQCCYASFREVRRVSLGLQLIPYIHVLFIYFFLFSCPLQLPPFRNSDPGSHSGHSSPLPTTAVRTGTVHALVCIACAYVFLVVSHSWINIVHACCEAQLNNNADDHAENAVGLGLLPVDVILTPCAVLTSGLDASLWLNLEWYPSG